MKKISLFLMCVVMIFATSGCGKKSLTCTSEADDIKMEMNLNFDSKEVFDNGTMIMTMEAPAEYTDEDLEETKKQFKEQFKKYDATVDIKDKKLVVTFKLTKDNLKDFDINGEATYDSILKEAEEDENTTCKKK